MENPFPVGSVNHTGCRSLQNYPGLFENRTQVLYSMFICYGTGFTWADGRLVDIYDEGRDKTDEEVQLVMPDSLKRKSGYAPMDARVDESIAEWDADNARRLTIRHNAAKLALTPGPLSGSLIGPTPQYAPYGSVPADAREDWAAACEEILAVVKPLWKAGKHTERAKRAERQELSPEVQERLRKLWQDVQSGTAKKSQ